MAFSNVVAIEFDLADPTVKPFPPIGDVLGWFRQWILDLDSIDPGALPPYDTPGGEDYFLIWDDSDQEYKGWTLQDATDYINLQHEQKVDPHPQYTTEDEVLELIEGNRLIKGYYNQVTDTVLGGAALPPASSYGEFEYLILVASGAFTTTEPNLAGKVGGVDDRIVVTGGVWELVTATNDYLSAIVDDQAAGVITFEQPAVSLLPAGSAMELIRLQESQADDQQVFDDATDYADGLMIAHLADYNPHDSMRWLGVWDSLQSYEHYDVVTDEGWLMIANKATTDRPAPQSSGPPTYDLPEAPGWTYNSFLGVAWAGHEYTITQGGWIKAIEIWAPELTVDTNYRVLLINNTDPANPIVTQIEEPVLLENAWTTVTIGRHVAAAGEVYGVILDALNSGSSTDWQHEWTYAGTSNAGAPAAGEWNRRTQQDVVRIHYQDAPGGDRQAELGTIIAGSTLRCSNTANVNQFWEYVVNAVTDTGTYYEFDVDLTATGSIGGVPDGANTLILATIPVLQQTQYVTMTGNWPAGNPAWATARGLLRLGGVDQPADNDAFGIRLNYETAYVSPDWDWLAGNIS